jgi:hypothetical protein
MNFVDAMHTMAVCYRDSMGLKTNGKSEPNADFEKMTSEKTEVS